MEEDTKYENTFISFSHQQEMIPSLILKPLARNELSQHIRNLTQE